MPIAETERILLEAARLFSGSGELVPAIARLVQLSVPRFADWCLVDLVTEDGEHFERVAIGHEGSEEVARALARRYPLRRDHPGVAAAIATGEPQLVRVMDEPMMSRIETDDAHGAAIRGMRMKSSISAPMIARGRTIGALTLCSSGRTYADEDTWFVEQLALVAASAIENARLYEAGRRAYIRMERLEQTVAALSRASTATEIAETACRIAGELMEATSGAIWLAQADGSLVTVGAWGTPAEFMDKFRVLRADTPRVPALEVLRTGVPIWVECEDDYRRVAPEILETARGEQRIASWGALPLDTAGRIVGVITFSHAIDHRYPIEDRVFYQAVAGHCAEALARAELLDQARRAEQHLRLALEAAEIGTWEYDPGTRLLHADERCRQILGMQRDAPLGRDEALARVHAADRAQVRDAEQRAADPAGSDELSLEYRVVGDDGRLRWVAVRGRARREAGRVVRFLGTAIDSTAARALDNERAALLDREREARAEAEAANRLKDDFLATVSHELRTPLHAISGWASRLASRLDDREALARGLELIGRNVAVQTRIIEDILDVSRIVAGKLQLDSQPIDLAAIVRDAVELARPQLAEKAQRLVLHLADRSPLHGDPQRLQQAIGNLLSNAVKFTDPGGEICVELSVEPERTSVIVRDTGRGIDPEFLPFVFDRFRQADSSSAREFGGLGLGLAIVQHLVELHGGRVRAESAGIGRGATFAIELPAREAAAAKAGERAPERLPDLAGCRILLVDDEPDARTLLGEVLEEVGALVRSAASAREALALHERFAPDVIVSDLNMPGEDGYALIRQIRARPGDGNPYAIALTASARELDRERSLAAGFDAHVSKPIDLAQLVGAIAAGFQAGRRTARSVGS